jgi:5'(3')-deoxyribonucleotidase
MDEVLSAFDLQFESLKSNSEKLSPLEWETKYGKDTLWDIIDPAGIEFWSEMKWFPGGKKLIQYLLPLKDKYDIQLLSTPSIEKDSRDGKALWVKNNLHDVFKLNLSFTKADYATPTSILIDDFINNINKWRKAGGIAIQHKNINDTLKQLKELGI